MEAIKIKKRIKTLTLLLLLSFLIVGITPLVESKTVQTNEELSNLRQEGYVLELGFPISFIEQGIPPLDPPMPFSFGFRFFDYKVFEPLNFFYSVGIVFITLVIFNELIRVLIKKQKDKRT